MILRSGRFVRMALGAIALLLAVFHAVLLWQRVADGSVLDPAVATEWLVGLALLLGLLRLRGLGLPLFRGRGAIVLWVLVLLLHAVAVVPDGRGLELGGEREALVAIPLGLVVGAALLHLPELLARLACRPEMAVQHRCLPAPAGRLSFAGFSLAFGSRAPPV